MCTRRSASISGVIALAVLLSVLASFVPSGASGYVHRWSCQRTAYDPCRDYSGQRYNPWMWVYIRMYARSGMCAKGVTAAGNLRSPQACVDGAYEVGACFDGRYPETWAYGYWGGSGTVRTIDGYANTDLCSVS